MKSSKKELKDLIKECLIEILAEGLGQSLVESTVRQAPARTIVPKRSFAHLEQRVLPKSQITGALNEAIRTESRGNKVLAEILTDTARTTLPTMLAGGDSSSGGRMTQQEQFNGSPEEVFGDEASSKWAELAFAAPSRNRLPDV